MAAPEPRVMVPLRSRLDRRKGPLEPQCNCFRTRRPRRNARHLSSSLTSCPPNRPCNDADMIDVRPESAGDLHHALIEFLYRWDRSETPLGFSIIDLDVMQQGATHPGSFANRTETAAALRELVAATR